MVGNTRSTAAKMFKSPVFTQDSLQPGWQVAPGLDRLCTCLLLRADYPVTVLSQSELGWGPLSLGASICLCGWLTGQKPVVSHTRVTLRRVLLRLCLTVAWNRWRRLNGITAATRIQQVFDFETTVTRTFYYHKYQQQHQLCWIINQQHLTVKSESWFFLSVEYTAATIWSGPSGICHPPTLLSLKSAPNLMKSWADVIAGCTQTRLLSPCLDWFCSKRRKTNFIYGRQSKLT